MASTKQVDLWPFWMTENSINYFAIWDQYATFIFFYFCSAKLPPAAILDDRKSLLITFLAISDQCASFFLNFVHKIATAAIFDDQKSLSIAFLSISDQCTTFLFFKFVFQNGRRRPFGSPICAKNNRILPLCAINGYAKYSVDR